MNDLVHFSKNSYMLWFKMSCIFIVQISLTVDNPQKVLLIGEAQDFGTCKAVKKNGDPCSQIVNLVWPSATSQATVAVVWHISGLFVWFVVVWVPVLPVSRQGPV